MKAGGRQVLAPISVIFWDFFLSGIRSGWGKGAAGCGRLRGVGAEQKGGDAPGQNGVQV